MDTKGKGEAVWTPELGWHDVEPGTGPKFDPKGRWSIAERVAPIKGAAAIIAGQLPATGIETDYVSLQDIVITGIENDFSFFGVSGYDPDADGDGAPWAILTPLADAGKGEKVALTITTVRKAVAAFLTNRMTIPGPNGEPVWTSSQAKEAMEDVDAPRADSILQFAVYGEEVFA
jgi:hypothetical protein